MNKVFIVLLLLIASSVLSAQNIAINTTGADPDGSALLDVSGANNGILVPRVALTTTSAATPVTGPAVSLLVYNTATVSDVTPGYYYWNGSIWVRFFDATVNSADHDWYKVGTTDSPSSINDNIFTQGNVGIGTTTPSTFFNIVALGSKTLARFETSSASGAEVDIIIKGARSTNTVENIASVKFNNYDTDEGAGTEYTLGQVSAGMQASSGTTGFLRFYTNEGANLTEKMRIDKDGNVGIGTTTPTSKLHVHSDHLGLQLTRTSKYPNIVFNTSDIDGLRLLSTPSGDFQITNYTSTSTRMSVMNNGNVGIGTTTPTSKLQIESSITYNDLRMNSTDAAMRFLNYTGGSNWIQSGLDYSSGSAADLRFSNMQGVVTNMIIKANGNVGIGTTAPNEKLEINGSIRMTDGNEAAGRIMISDANGTGSWQDASAISPSSMEDSDGDTKIQVEESSDDDIIRFDTRGSEQMVIDSVGNVGIGTSSPVAKLEVDNGGVRVGRNVGDMDINSVVNGADNQNVRNSILMSRDGDLTWDITNKLWKKPNGPNNDFSAIIHRLNTLGFYKAGNVDLTAGVTNTVFRNDYERLTIMNNGNVGIGAVVPSATLEINPKTDNNVPLLYLEKVENWGAETGILLEMDGEESDTLIHLKSAVNAGVDPLTTKFIVLGDGDVGIGTTAPTAPLVIEKSGLSNFGQLILREPSTPTGSTDRGPHMFFENSSGQKGWLGYFDSATHGDGVQFNIRSYTGPINMSANSTSGSHLFIANSGNVGIGTMAPSEKLHVIGNILASGTITSSDERYKKDVKEIENASAIIDKLRPVSYLFRVNEFEGQFDEKRHYGVIAQEIEKVLPELVYTDDKGFKAVNYTDLISVLLKGIQEHRDNSVDQEQKFSLELKSQKKQLDAQKKQIEELKSLIMSRQK